MVYDWKDFLRELGILTILLKWLERKLIRDVTHEHFSREFFIYYLLQFSSLFALNFFENPMFFLYTRKSIGLKLKIFTGFLFKQFDFFEISEETIVILGKVYEICQQLVTPSVMHINFQISRVASRSWSKKPNPFHPKRVLLLRKDQTSDIWLNLHWF